MGARVGRVLGTRRTPVAVAVVLVTHKASPLLDFIRPRLRACGVDEAGGGVSGRPPVGRPLPHVSDHVVQLVVGLDKHVDRVGPGEPVFARILAWKASRPNVGVKLVLGLPFIAPGKESVFFPISAGHFPF